MSQSDIFFQENKQNPSQHCEENHSCDKLTLEEKIHAFV